MIAYVVVYQYVMCAKLFCSRQIYKCNKDKKFGANYIYLYRILFLIL